MRNCCLHYHRDWYEKLEQVNAAARGLRSLRTRLIREQGLSLRSLYRTLEIPGENVLKNAHVELDQTVRDSYGMGKRDNVIEHLFKLNQALSVREGKGKPVTGPGLPPCVKDASKFITEDCFPLDAS